MPVADFTNTGSVYYQNTPLKRVCFGDSTVWPSWVGSGPGWYLEWIDPGKETLEATFNFWYDKRIYTEQPGYQLAFSWGTSVAGGNGVAGHIDTQTIDAPGPGPAWATLRAPYTKQELGRIYFTVRYTQQVTPYNIPASLYEPYAIDDIVDWGANGVAMPAIDVLAGRDFTIEGSQRIISEAGYGYQNMWICKGDNSHVLWGTIVDNGNLGDHGALQTRYGGRINHPSDVKAGDHAFLCVGDNYATSGESLLRINFI